MKALRIIVNIVAVFFLLSGALWALQGQGLVGGSPMTGNSEWIRNGLITMAICAVVLFVVNRKKKV